MQDENKLSLLIQSNKRLILSFFTVVGLFVVLFFFYNNNHPYNVTEYDKTIISDPTNYINNKTEFSSAVRLYKDGKLQESEQEFSRIIQEESNMPDSVFETLKLYQIASLRGYDREAAFQEYYKFYKNVDNTLLNRAYALLMAQQNTLSYDDPKKLLFVLSEEEVKNIKTLDSANISYVISQKIYSLYPFPITAARLANFEISQLDVKDLKNKEVAKSIYDKYMFGFDDNIQMMLSQEGLRHLVSNSYLNKANLMSKMYGLGLETKDNVSNTYDEAFKYANLYSPKGTDQFVLLAYLNHLVKIQNDEGVKKILQELQKIKTSSGLIQNVKTMLSKEDSLKDNFVNIYERYKKDEGFRNEIQVLVK